jgi:diguanylate cyclase (GGDEF)-like protein
VLARISDALSREGNSGLSAVLFMDLDKLKAVNDSLGHEAGDQMIRVAAHRLQLVMGPDDVAARLGGDEFVALLFGLTGRRELDDVSARLHTALAEPTRIADTTMGLSASIGVTAVDAHDERDAAAILHDADVAMYQAKTTGIGTSHAVDKQPPAEPLPAPRD